jgi:hypothetical protein
MASLLVERGTVPSCHVTRAQLHFSRKRFIRKSKDLYVFFGIFLHEEKWPKNGISI